MVLLISSPLFYSHSVLPLWSIESLVGHCEGHQGNVLYNCRAPRLTLSHNLSYQTVLSPHSSSQNEDCVHTYKYDI